MGSVRVVIFGAEYSIKGDVDSEITRQVARYVNSKMAEVHETTPSRDNIKIAVLSALNIAGELFELKDKQEKGAQRMNEITDRLTSISRRIDVDCNKVEGAHPLSIYNFSECARQGRYPVVMRTIRSAAEKASLCMM